MEIHPNGRFLYVSNRDNTDMGRDSIVIFRVDERTGFLTAAGSVPSGGRTPRHFKIAPGGRFLVMGNQNGNTIVVFAIDSNTGALSRVGEPIAIDAPACFVFVPLT